MRALSVVLAVIVTFSAGAAALASVSVGGLTYSIRSAWVTSHVGDEDFGAKASGEFIVVKLTIRNTGREPATISDSDFHLVAGGAMYDASSAGMGAGGFFLEKLNPGVSKTGIIVFDVPAHTSISKYRLQVYGNGTDDHRDIPL